MNQGYLYVFDYSSPAILEIECTDADSDLTSEEILEKHGYRESDCYFMYSQDKLEIIPIEE